MKKSDRKKRMPKRVLRLPDLDSAKRSVLNTLGSPASKRAYEFGNYDFVTWYCSEPRLAFNKTVVLRYRIELESRRLAPATINLRLAAVRRLAYEAADTGAGIAKLSPHDGRRTCARLCHVAGGELEQIQFLLGHVSVETTERYLGCKQRLRSAVNDHIGLEP